MRQYDWVDRVAGIKSLDVDSWLEGEWVHYPVGPWTVWPWWRRLLDLVRARTLGVAHAAVITAVYFVRTNPSNLWLEDQARRVALVPAHVVFGSMRSLNDIQMRWCMACDSPEHVHKPSEPTPKL